MAKLFIHTLAAMLLALPAAAQGTGDLVTTCTTDATSVEVLMSDQEGFPFQLRHAGTEPLLAAKAQSVFGKLGATANSTEAQIVVNVILREDDTVEIVTQRYGEASVSAAATCADTDALRATLVAAIE